MTTAFDPIASVAAEAAVNALPEHVSLGSITTLPRGADAFVGTPRPLLLGCTRWLHAAPGGVMIGGSPAAVAAALGFDVPERPTPVAAEDRAPDAPPPPKWSDLVVEAATANLTTVSQAIAAAVADLADIPPACATTQVSMNENDGAVRAETGTIPDACVLMLHVEDQEIRLVVVVPGIFVARLSAERAPDADDPNDADADAEAPPTRAASRASALSGALGRGLSKVPLELSIELGRARVPLAHVLQLRDGEVLELQQTTDSPVELVSGDSPVARGDLEVSEQGNLVLHVTGIPGQPTPASAPRVMAERAVDRRADHGTAALADATEAVLGDGAASSEAPAAHDFASSGDPDVGGDPGAPGDPGAGADSGAAADAEAGGGDASATAAVPGDLGAGADSGAAAGDGTDGPTPHHTAASAAEAAEPPADEPA